MGRAREIADLIGGTTPDIILKTSDGAILNLQTSDTTVTADSVLGAINFQAPDEASGTDSILIASKIEAIAEGTFSASSNATSLVFSTASSAAAGTVSGKMTFTSGGNLIIKDTDTADGSSPTITLQSGDTDIAADDILGSINFQAPDEGTGTDAILVAAGIEAVSEGDFSSSSNATKLSFKTGASEAASEKMSIASTGATTITTSGNEDTLSLVSTDADANAGPQLVFNRNSASPADNDLLGKIKYTGNDDAGNQVDYATINIKATDVSDGSEDGEFDISTVVGGTSRSRMRADGAETIFNENSVDVDFRVESDSKTHMLFVDGGNNRVGIGTDTTSALLTVDGTGSYQATTNTSGLTITGATALQNAGKLKLSGAGTNLDHIEIDNDGGNLVIGLERSAGAGIIGSGPSYAGVFGTVSNTPIVFGANNAAKASIGGTGEFRVAQLVSGNPGAGTDGFIVTPDNGILITSNGQLIRAYSTNSGTPVFSVTAAGAVSKASGSFRIKHPLSHLNATHNLVHSFVEAPEAANIYRGKITLSGGSATINIDTISGMTDGTFEALNRDVQCFTSNETGWTAVKGSVSSQSYDFQLEDGSGSLIDESGNTLITEVTTGNILTITAQENSCTDTISWMVIGQRHDSHMYDTDWTNENGRVVVEPLQTAAAAYIPNS